MLESISREHTKFNHKNKDGLLKLMEHKYYGNEKEGWKQNDS